MKYKPYSRLEGVVIDTSAVQWPHPSVIDMDLLVASVRNYRNEVADYLFINSGQRRTQAKFKLGDIVTFKVGETTYALTGETLMRHPQGPITLAAEFLSCGSMNFGVITVSGTDDTAQFNLNNYKSAQPGIKEKIAELKKQRAGSIELHGPEQFLLDVYALAASARINVTNFDPANAVRGMTAGAWATLLPTRSLS